MEPLFYVDLDGGDDVCTGCAARLEHDLGLNLAPQYEITDVEEVIVCVECNGVINDPQWWPVYS